MQLWYGAEHHALAQLATQEARTFFQPFLQLCHRLRIILHRRAIKNLGMRHVTANLDLGNRDHADARVLHLKLQQVSQLTSDLFGYSITTGKVLGHYRVLATSTTSNTSSVSPTWMSLKLLRDKPHSKLALISFTSSLKRLSDSSSPVWMTTLSR